MQKSMSKNEVLPFFLLIFLLFILIEAVSYQWQPPTTPSVEFVDTDAYMRMVRVEQLAVTGDWYDSTIHRSNYPYGDELHWTRPLDVLILGVAYLLRPFMGFDQGLIVSGIAISPFLGVCSLAALYWAARRVLNINARRLLWLLFISQILLLNMFSFGRPDHHSLLLLLFILMMGCLFRFISEGVDCHRWVMLCGLIGSLSLWVSVESIFAIITAFLVLGYMWFAHDKSYAAMLLLFSLSLFASSLIFLFLERPIAAIFAVEYDKISIVHLYIFAVAVIATYLMTFIRNKSVFSRVLRLSALLIASTIAIYMIFPLFFQGPMAGVNKDIVPIWLSSVLEVRPLWSLDPFLRSIVIVSIALFVAYTGYLFRSRRCSEMIPLLVPILCGFAVYLPLGVYQIRMDYYLLVIIIIVLAKFMDDILSRVSRSNLRDGNKLLLRTATLFLFILGLPGIGVLASLGNLATGSPANPTFQPDMRTVASFLDSYQEQDQNARTLLVYQDFAPELLFRTNFNVIATPYHRNDQGILFNYDVMAESNLDRIKEMLEERSVDLIMICPQSMEGNYYKKTIDRSTFYERMADGHTPPFSAEIALPADLEGKYRAYRIIN